MGDFKKGLHARRDKSINIVQVLNVDWVEEPGYTFLLHHTWMFEGKSLATDME